MLRSAVVVSWFLAMGWLLSEEAFPHWFHRASVGYRDLLRSGPVIMDSWMRILFQGRQIGYSHTRLDTQDRNPLEPYLVQNRTLLDLNVMGRTQTISLYGQASLDPLYNLQRFVFNMTTPRYAVRIEGKRTSRTSFSGRIWTQGTSRRFVVEVPEDVVLYSPMMDLAVSRLKPGESLKVKTFDPVSFASSEVSVCGVRNESIVVGKTQTNALLVEVLMRGVTFRAWVDADGRLLRQETPMGWILEASSADEAVQMVSSEGAPEMLRVLAVPCEGALGNARACRRLVARFRGWPADFDFTDDERQRTIFQKEGVLEIETRAAAVPPRDTPVVLSSSASTGSTVFIQADAPAITRKAREIVAGLTNAVEQTLALNEWVFRNVRKQPTVSLPSAVDVLKTMEGDCNEHTYLFVALARALRLPARVRVGLVYMDGAFYYHAWPIVEIGNGWELDPTLGQAAVDATHITLLEGELEQQIKLMSIVGRVNAVILDEDS